MNLLSKELRQAFINNRTLARYILNLHKSGADPETIREKVLSLETIETLGIRDHAEVELGRFEEYLKKSKNNTQKPTINLI